MVQAAGQNPPNPPPPAQPTRDELKKLIAGVDAKLVALTPKVDAAKASADGARAEVAAGVNTLGGRFDISDVEIAATRKLAATAAGEASAAASAANAARSAAERSGVGGWVAAVAAILAVLGGVWLATRVNAVDGKVAEVAAQVAANETKLDRILGNQETIAQGLNQGLAELAGVKSAVGGLSTEVGGLKKTVGTIEKGQADAAATLRRLAVTVRSLKSAPAPSAATVTVVVPDGTPGGQRITILGI